jgi:hypothetical protein
LDIDFFLLNSLINKTEKTKKKGDLVVHHLYSAKTYPHLTYVIENGIVLEKEFHKTFQYTNNTVSQFKEFLMLIIEENKLSMPISSQTSLKKLEGSETRVYDPNRVMRLHEFLERVDQNLQSRKT